MHQPACEFSHSGCPQYFTQLPDPHISGDDRTRSRISELHGDDELSGVLEAHKCNPGRPTRRAAGVCSRCRPRNRRLQPIRKVRADGARAGADLLPTGGCGWKICGCQKGQLHSCPSGCASSM